MVIRKIPAIITAAIISVLATTTSRAEGDIQYQEPSLSGGVRLKDLARIDGARDNALIGYGIVVGLAGTGDSSRSRGTLQSVSNMLGRFGVVVPADELNTRNVAAVTVTATLPPHANIGDQLSINVASLGDARSLLGGTLVMAPLRGPDGDTYALAQGPISVGGFRYDAFGNAIQKNHPTVGTVPGGATIEKVAQAAVVDQNGDIQIVLRNPDYTTASRVVAELQREFGDGRGRTDPISALGPGRIRFTPTAHERGNLVATIQRIENLRIQPGSRARIVVNERTGTVVSGGDVRLDSITVAQGNLKVEISTDYLVSQPAPFSRVGGRTTIVPDTEIRVEEGVGEAISLPSGSTVADLVLALNAVRATPRDIISVLQSVQQAGALHAELVIR